MFDTLTFYLTTLLSLDLLRQFTAFGFVIIIAWISQFLLRRLLDRISERVPNQSVWSERLVALVKIILWPLLVRVLNVIAVATFENVGWQNGLLVWVTTLVTLWLFYRFIVALLNTLLPKEVAAVWSGKIILPLILIAAALHSLGIMDDVLSWPLTPRDDLNVTVGSIITGLITLALFFLFSRGAEQYLNSILLPQLRISRALSQALSRVLSYGVIIFGVVLSLGLMGVNLTTITVVAGGLSVGLGFGLQEIVSNFVSGFILMFERSISPGDVLQIGDTVGVVQRINVRSMIIRTQDNVELIVPNSKFLTETVTNLTRTQNIVRVRVGVGVTYDADPRQVEQILLQAAEHEQVLKIPEPTVQFTEFGDSSLNFDLLIWTNDAARILPLASDIRYNIWEALKANDIEIPFPQRDLHVRSGIPWDQLGTSSHGKELS